MFETEQSDLAEAELRALRKKLTASKCRITRLSNNLESLLSDSEFKSIAVRDMISEIQLKLKEFDEIENQIEAALPEEEMLQQLNEAEDYKEPKRTLLHQAKQALVEKEETPVTSVRNQQAVPEVNLPKLDIGNFSGSVLEWTSFNEKFEALIDKKSLPNVTKFTYLLSALKGEARGVIQGLAVTDANYQVAKRLLNERFGRKEPIRFAHIQALLNLSPMPRGQKNVTSLWTWKDSLVSHIRSLEGLGVDAESCGIFLTPIILSRLPHQMRMEWSRDGEGKEADLEFLLQSLTREIRRIERSDSFRESSSPQEQRTQMKSQSSVSSLHVSSKPVCVFCEKPHPSHKCRKVPEYSERQDRIRNLRLCFRCLSSNHIARTCSKVCEGCGGNHHLSLCRAQRANSDTPSQAEKRVPPPLTTQDGSSQNLENDGQTSLNLVSTVALETQRRTALPVIEVVVSTCKEKVVTARLLLDSGSDKTYVSSELVKEIQPQFVGCENVQYAAFGNERAKKGVRNTYSLHVQGTKRGKGSVIATEIPTICTPMCRPTIPLSKLSSFSNIQLVDTGIREGEPFTIDILVGLDNYWNFVQSGVLPGIDGLVAQETIFGWMITGSWESSVSVNAMCLSTQLLCIQDIPESMIRNLWSVESIGIAPNESESTFEADPVQSHFSENVKLIDGRYEVALPWNKQKDDLLDNEYLAQKRLSSLRKRLDVDVKLRDRYDSVFEEYEALGFIEEVSSGGPPSQPTYYMPHHPVIKEHSSSTKVRPVFDASAKGFNGISLNDCMDAGPSLIPSLVEVLLRFRRWKVALSADITKAFLQIAIREEDRNAHRFLWDKQGQVRKMRFTRVPFGNKSSPFLLNATIQHHLASLPTSRVVRELAENLYVDDWLSGADNEDEANDMMKEAKGVMCSAGMILTKWHSNKLCLDVGEKEQGVSAVKVLGISWESTNDCFYFAKSALPPLEGLTCTKRGILSMIARVYDPLGYLAPLTMAGKMIFQDLWCLGIGWDEKVPEKHQEEFTSWVKGLDSVSNVQVPRCFCSGRSWNDTIDNIEFHAFGDASTKGYGAVIYCRVPKFEGGYRISFVMSKGKIAPIKKVTLPRLELLAALLCARLVRFVVQALRLTLDCVRISCWTDSMIALGWIKGDAVRWKPFVANRVREIQELTNPSCWRHCVSEENPADVVSRGSNGSRLASNELWWQGPRWLASETVAHKTCSETSKFPPDEQSIVCSVSSCVTESIIDVSRYSTLEKAMRVTGWVLRFIAKLKSKQASTKFSRNVSQLSLDELTVAKETLLLLTQRNSYPDEFERLKKGLPVRRESCLKRLNPFLDSNELLRVGGRLDRSDLLYEEKHPIILPKCHLSLLLVRSQHVRHKHPGVDTMLCMLRSTYWIVGVRRLAKRVKRDCISCQKQDVLACNQPCAPLPSLRVREAPPFSVTGLDFAGPLYACDVPGKKLYFLLFTCAVVRAVHVELVDSMSVNDCLMAIRRFCARRGSVTTFYSDNAKTFISVANHLHTVLGPNIPEWRFIAPRSPWWGGWWERLVRSIKSGLRKSIGNSCLTRSELETNLIEVESCVNSRPLTFVGDDSDSLDPLTPSHFLIGKIAGLQCMDSSTKSLSPSRCRERWDLTQQRLKLFWSRWTKEYLRSLPPAVSNFKAQCRLKVGSIVLIKEDNLPKLKWPLGKVIELHPGKDGIVRSVTLKTARGVIKRSIQCLRDLEITEVQANENDTERD